MRAVVVCLVSLGLAAGCGARKPPAEKTAPLTAVPFTDVRVEDEFLRPWLERNRRVTVWHNLRMCEETGIIDNFAKAAGRLPGADRGALNSDETVYKTVEAASFELAREPDAALDRELDRIIELIGAAQEPDGYLNTHRTIQLRDGAPNTRPRWSNLKSDLELYLGGHLYEAAVAHHQATGKRALLDVAIRHADLVDSIFGLARRRDVGGHPNVEQALVKLYAATGEERYYRLAKFFVDERGRANGRELYGPFCQDHMPILDQKEAVGQAPRATYLYSGVADVARISGDPAYREALERLWEDVAGRKMYVTGGIGSKHDNEGFSDPYDLPNKTAYAESCAAVSFSMWNHRMFLLTGDAKYIDVLERTIYNNFLAGTSLAGDAFFYPIPLEADGKWEFNRGWIGKAPGEYKEGAATRKKWFYCACCPPNNARYIAWLPAFFYARRGDELFVNFFATSAAEVELGGGKIGIRQETRYPWEGAVRITLEPARPMEATLKIRLPGWSQGRPAPGDLYRYVTPSNRRPSLKVNGEATPLALDRGYAVISRRWQSGDAIDLNLPMRVHAVASHPSVKENEGKVAFERGPIVYCVEGADHEGRVLNLRAPDADSLTAEYRQDFLGGVTVLRGRTERAGGEEADFLAIPYYAWSNRGPGEMAVWLPAARRLTTGAPP